MEPAMDYIKRSYTLRQEDRTPSEIFTSFSNRNMELFGEGKDVANLLLFGEPGNGKTSFEAGQRCQPFPIP